MLLSRAARVPGANATCGATSRRCSHRVVRLLAQQGSGGSMDSSSSSSSGDAQKQANLPQEGTTDSAAMFSSLSFASRLRGQDKGNRGTNVVLAGDGSEDTWRKLDKRVNSYPGQRDFTAIGTGGDGFRASMVSAVEQVVGSVHVECVSQKTRGAWISVTVGPVWVENGDQVLAIYEAMRRDERLKYFI